MKIEEKDYLKHIGILGMHWGQRKSSSSSSSSGTGSASGRIKRNYEKSLLDARRVYEHKGSGKDPRSMTKKEIDSEISTITSRTVTPRIQRNIQRENEKLLNKRIKAYNKTADYANKVLIPNINKKYGKYDWSKLDTSDPRNPKGDPKLVASYNKYLNEYETSLRKIYNKHLSEV